MRKKALICFALALILSGCNSNLPHTIIEEATTANNNDNDTEVPKWNWWKGGIIWR